MEGEIRSISREKTEKEVGVCWVSLCLFNGDEVKDEDEEGEEEGEESKSNTSFTHLSSTLVLNSSSSSVSCFRVGPRGGGVKSPYTRGGGSGVGEDEGRLEEEGKERSRRGGGGEG